MTASLDITIGPTLKGRLRYLALAPSAPGAARYQLSFQAEFTNTGPAPVTVTVLRVTFPTAPGLGMVDIAIQTETWVGDQVFVSDGLMLAPGQKLPPKDFTSADNIILTSPPPLTIAFDAFVAGDPTPARRVYSLRRHETPVEGGYRWFAEPAELGDGEYWQGVGAVHCCGPQLFAIDLGVFRYSKATGWSDLHPGTSGKKNEHYRTYGKPIHAMAAGTVVSFDDTIPDNPEVGKTLAKVPAYGSHFIVLHGDEEMLYAHLQPGSMNAELKSPGAVVAAGQVLGAAGNSGNSSKPHLHIHAVDKARKMLRPIPWRSKMIAIQGAGHATPDRWRASVDEGLATRVGTLVYPADVPPADASEWTGWLGRGGTIASGPTVSSWSPNRLDIFAVDSQQALGHMWWDGNAWRGWESLGGVLTSKPTAVSWGPHRIDVFARGLDNGLYHRWWDGEQWLGWEPLGGNLRFAPAVCSRRFDHLDVFGIDDGTGALVHRIWTGTKWTEWESLGGVLASAPAAVAWAADRIDVFARGMDDKLWHHWWDGSAWSGWVPHGAPMIHGPAVSSRRENRLDVFIVAPDGTLRHKVWNGTVWGGWEGLGGILTDDPAAVSWNKNRIDVFARGTDDSLYQNAWIP